MPDLTFVKGHGTENDFVLIPDRAGQLDLDPAVGRRICDRRAGIGADGVIRVAPGPAGRFLMDYRNADGSPAEMCGNGARVFARFLVDAGWVALGRFEFETRGGTRWAELGPAGDVTIGMGPVRLQESSAATVAGRALAGIAVDVGNPHLACSVDDVDGLDLTNGPGYDAELFPAGVNIEFYRSEGPDRVRMRVFERGSGETRSCGTGTVAVAAAQLSAIGRAAGTVEVAVPGGRVAVTLTDPTRSPHGWASSTLSGPAVVVARGTIDAGLLRG